MNMKQWKKKKPTGLEMFKNCIKVEETPYLSKNERSLKQITFRYQMVMVDHWNSWSLIQQRRNKKKMMF